MALRLRELFGHDPLTIDQTGCWATDHGVTPGQIGFDEAGEPVTAGLAEGRVDLQVRQPVPESHGRPEWLLQIGRVPVLPPESFRPDETPVVIEARLTSEPHSATPIDRLYLAPGERLPLYLTPGEYSVRALTDNGSMEVNGFQVFE